jgi:uncharacterized protein YihD (DUF1040 family)
LELVNLQSKSIELLTDQELLALIKKEDLTKEDVFVNDKHIAIAKILHKYQIERGDQPIPPMLLHTIVKYHLKHQASDKDEVLLYFSMLYEMDANGCFLISKKSSDIIYDIFPRDEYGSRWRKEYLEKSEFFISQFIKDKQIKKGRVAVNVTILYLLFSKWVKEQKQKTTRYYTFLQIMTKKFVSYQDNLKMYVLIDESIKEHLTPEILNEADTSKAKTDEPKADTNEVQAPEPELPTTISS